ncbi:MAG TPA: hypothetical protein VNV65_02690 [Candidatus Solibacter sp.]|jgi:hypothetical protein|nr:hypothetical protein [Candidatus Solibacter sp.]
MFFDSFGAYFLSPFIFVLIIAAQIAFVLLVARFAVWYLTPVAYRRWKQLEDEDSRRG